MKPIWMLCWLLTITIPILHSEIKEMTEGLVHKPTRSLWNEFAPRFHHYWASICPHFKGGIIFLFHWINNRLDPVPNSHQIIWVLPIFQSQLILENGHRSLCRRTGVIVRHAMGYRVFPQRDWLVSFSFYGFWVWELGQVRNLGKEL